MNGPLDVGIAEVVDQLQERLDALPPGPDPRRAFLGTYVRMTTAIGEALAAEVFEDPGWVRHWDLAFVSHYLAAHDADVAGGEPPRPWRLAFGADPGLPTLVHLLLEMNAHVNYDLPQAILEVVSDEEFRHPVLMAMRRRDHERIDTVISARVGAEGRVLPGVGRFASRVIAPLDRWSTRRFLPAARGQVWANVIDLHEARCIGPDAYAARLIELDVLTSAQIADLLHPGPVLLRLAVRGFGVRLPPP